MDYWLANGVSKRSECATLTAHRHHDTMLVEPSLCCTAAKRHLQKPLLGIFVSKDTTTMFSAADKAWVAGLIGLVSHYGATKLGMPMSPELVAFLTAAGVYWTPNKATKE